MARLSQELGAWLARVEILAHGAERARQEATRALESGRLGEARARALAILDELPRSRVALALWAEAAELMGLDEEAYDALERLSRELPFRADVWLRLAGAGYRTGREPTRALEHAVEASEPTVAADEARLWLADRDLARGDPARAERWLDQLSLARRATSEARRRRVEAWLGLGEVDRARRAAGELVEPEPLDGRGWLLRGRLLDLAGADPAFAFRRALLLETPGSGEVVSSYVARAGAAGARALGGVVDSLGLADHPSWRAAFSIAAGRLDAALAALAEGLERSPTPELVRRYLAEAVKAENPDALRDALSWAERVGEHVEPGLAALQHALDAQDDRSRLAALELAAGSTANWAEALRRDLYASWLPRDAPARWDELVAELGELSRRLGEVERFREVEAIVVEQMRPLLVAVVGEFNAGKSSFINALLGEEVAPVGVLPTTATVNRLVWSLDRFVRIERRMGHDRVVTHSELRRTLAELDPRSIAQVTIYAPLEPLRRIELVDTPGFNAGDDAHTGLAKNAISEAHAVIWLCDATQPLKDTERAVLSEIAALGVPLLVLVNKLDRLDEGEGAQVLAHLVSGLEACAIQLEASPLGLSARQALAGRGGDTQALERSGWTAVEALVEDRLVARSSELRERALRRRAAHVAVALAQVAGARARARRQSAAEQAADSANLDQACAAARGRAPEICKRLSEDLQHELETLDQDLRPVVGFEREPAGRRFIVARARAGIAPALTRIAVQELGLSGSSARRVEQVLGPRVSAMVGATAAALKLPSAGELGGQIREQLLEQVFVELLGATGELAAEPPPLLHDALEARTRSLAEALRGAV